MPARRTYPLVALVILDGWGLAPPGPGNAIELAETRTFDELWERHPTTTLSASGEDVGLPPGQMGNSEVGHLNIGAGRVVDQDFLRITHAIQNGTFFSEQALSSAFARARERSGNVHLMGLVSYGGVHSHIDHLRALVELSRREEMADRTYVHAFTDGRDVSPTASVSDLAELVDEGTQIATVVGRYYAMDRDKRWQRTDRALQAIIDGVGEADEDPVASVRASYDAGITDEFIEPIILAGPRLSERDSVIFFNFRPDRARQLCERLIERGFDLTTMTSYRADFGCPVAFEEHDVDEGMAEVLSERGIRQLHAAETEKYPHVTYFFNGGHEEKWEGEVRILVPSPRDVPTYDHRPEMSAPELTREFVEEVGNDYGFAILNFANPDMVGHTGVIPAVVKAVETVDRCLRKVVDAVHTVGGVCVITADHGNAEEELQTDGSPHTAHTTNPVPLIITVDDGELAEGGRLADLIPTCLALMDIPPSDLMTGRDLLSSP